MQLKSHPVRVTFQCPIAFKVSPLGLSGVPDLRRAECTL